jgi:four helix bundle protein
MKNFRDLKVWVKSHQLTLDIYRVTCNFPNHEIYGLTSQIRRCCASIPSNIAEGCGRGSDADLGRFLQIGLGSASEAEYQLLLTHDLEYLPDSEYQRLNSEIIEIKRMLASLVQKLKADR